MNLRFLSRPSFTLLGIVLLIPLSKTWADYAYGLYGHYPVGSTRILAMGGAFAGLSDDASALNFNPAGLALSKARYDIQSGSNRIVNKEIDLLGTGEKIGVPYNFSFYSAAVKVGSWAFGAGLSKPYSLNPNSAYSNTSTLLEVSSYDALIAYQWSSGFSIGITGHYEQAVMAYSYPYMAIDARAEAIQSYPTVGLSYRPSPRSGFGVSYAPERRFIMDTSANSQLGYPLFRNMVIPGKTTLGFFKRTGQSWLWVFDLDLIDPVKEGLSFYDQSSYPRFNIIQQTAMIFHGGFELQVLTSKDVDFLWRGGGYSEPPRFEGYKPRPHFTMGVELRLGPLTLAAAYDQAEGFNNMAQSISLSLKTL